MKTVFARPITASVISLWQILRAQIIMMIEILRLQDAVFCENIPKSDYIREK